MRFTAIQSTLSLAHQCLDTGLNGTASTSTTSLWTTYLYTAHPVVLNTTGSGHLMLTTPLAFTIPLLPTVATVVKLYGHPQARHDTQHFCKNPSTRTAQHHTINMPHSAGELSSLTFSSRPGKRLLTDPQAWSFSSPSTANRPTPSSAQQFSSIEADGTATTFTTSSWITHRLWLHLSLL